MNDNINEKFDIEDAVWQLGVLLLDETEGLLQTTLKVNFDKEYERFDLVTAWECFVSRVDRIDKVCDLHDFLVNNMRKIKKIEEFECFEECIEREKILKKENEQLKRRIEVLESFLEDIRVTSASDEHLNINLLQLLTEDDTYFSEYFQKKTNGDSDE